MATITTLVRLAKTLGDDDFSSSRKFTDYAAYTSGDDLQWLHSKWGIV
ncbi:MAG: hypothetical protein WDO73_08900 [Ignavibacteriota bacterium]